MTRAAGDAGARGADFLQLSPASAPARGLTSWLADAVRAAVIDGRLQAGAPLPATRVLAEDLGISRGVIVEAYQRLADEGLVSARPGAGTRVLGVRRAIPPGAVAPEAAPRVAVTTGARARETGRLPERWRARGGVDLSPRGPDPIGRAHVWTP